MLLQPVVTQKMQVVISLAILNTAVVIDVVAVTSLDQNIALVPTLPRLFKRHMHKIQKNRTYDSDHGDRERECVSDL